MKKLLIYIIIIISPALSLGIKQNSAAGAASCVSAKTVNAVDTALHIINGVYYYNNDPLNGTLVSYYPDGKPEEKTAYTNGKQNGLSETWFDNGQIKTQRLYVNGEKDGTHYGWYSNGPRRFEYNFKNGAADGESIEWYPSGTMFKKTVYNNGNEERVQAWRENGKLYANYVVKDGVIYGLNNSNLCYSLKNEQGEYVPSK